MALQSIFSTILIITVLYNMKLVHCRNDAAIPTMDYKYYNNNNNGNGNNNYNYQYEYNKHAYSPLEDKAHWYRTGNSELNAAFRLWLNNNTAKNVILFVGDGMDPNTVTATRIYKEGESGKLSFEKFPHIGLLKTYSVDKQVPDSASSATALFTGVKTKNGIIGLDATANLEDCRSSMVTKARLSSIMQWAQESGKDTGFVTNTRVTHSTPSALYANSASHKWESDSTLKDTLCKDIARQLVEDDPGRNFKVIFGGGRQCLINSQSSVGDEIDINACERLDSKNLIKRWEEDKMARRAQYQYIDNVDSLRMLDIRNVEYVLGLFANSHMKYEHMKNDTYSRKQPSLLNMTEAAIHILKKNNNGFFLMVESGLIDIAHHEGHAGSAIKETAHFDDTIQKTIDVLYRHNMINDTLVIVTGDHGHTLSINGYPPRFGNILGIAQESKHDNVPYTTLSYSTGKKSSMQFENGKRKNPMEMTFGSDDFTRPAAIVTDEETHGGGDIIVYAIGPKSHFFHSIHEQTYVAHVISYAANVGPYKVNAASPTLTNAALSTIAFTVTITVYRFF